jgi:ABC-type nitrate/sulfonate/bicarbonate transport system permease component
MWQGQRYTGALRRALRAHAWVIGILALLVLWLLASGLGWVGKTLLASPGEVLDVVRRAFGEHPTKSQQFYVHGYHTILRATEGWGLSLLLGVAVGLALGIRSLAYRASEPVVEFFRAIPPILAFPLLLVAFNYGDRAYVWTVVFGCLPVMVLTVARGTQAIPREPLDLLRAHDVAPGVQLFARAVEVLPSVFLGARITFSISLVIAVVSEMVFTPRSGWALGSLARDAEIDFDTPTFYACLISIGLFGYAVNAGLRRLEHRFGFAGEGEET